MTYLTKKDMLAEIHKCKLSYCSFMEPEHGQYDLIVGDLSDVTDEIFETARASKIAKLSKGRSKSVNVVDGDLVFRVMTHEHVPLDPERKRRSRAANPDHAQTNFSPFKHYVREDGVWREVLRSHWVGGFDNGYFSIDHGRISNKLGAMFMKLVENYARIGRYRSYSYNDEMKGNALLHLISIALRFDESKSDNPFGFFSTSVKHVFTRVLNIEKRVQDIRDDLLIASGASPSMARQIDNELSQRPELRNPEQKALVGKRGRKTAAARAAIEEAIKEEENLTKE